MNDDILNKNVGNKEKATLEAKPVLIKLVEVRPPKEGSKALLAYFHCEHPDCKELLGKDTIDISQVKVENLKTHKMEVVGLWINTDAENNLQKGSTTANFLKFVGVNNLKECEGKILQTTIRENGFLAFRGY